MVPPPTNLRAASLPGAQAERHPSPCESHGSVTTRTQNGAWALTIVLRLHSTN